MIVTFDKKVSLQKMYTIIYLLDIPTYLHMEGEGEESSRLWKTAVEIVLLAFGTHGGL